MAKETRRQKRKVTFEESDSDSIYACVKVVVDRQAYRLGVKVRNMKMDFNIYGAWRRVEQ